MKRLLLLMLYLNTWVRGLFWLCALGLALLAATVVTALLIDRHTAFGLSLYAYAALLGLPYFAAWYPFRQLIASRRLSLLPQFPVYTGLALLLLTVLVSVYLPLSAALLWPGAIPWQSAIYLFFIASLYTCLLQWLCTSTLFLPVMTFAPFAFMLLTQRDNTLQLLLAQHPAIDGSLLLLTLAGWLWGLRVLATKRAHTAPLKALASQGDMFSGHTNWYLPFSKPAQASSSPTRSLLLGYPDRWFNRAQFHCNMIITWPLLLTALMALIGELSFSRFPATLLVVALVCSILATAGNGELAARARLIWLRHDGNRQQLWTIVERLLLGNIAWQTLFLGLLSLVTWSAPLPSQLQPFNLLVSAVPIWLLGTYCMLAARAGHWPGLATALLVCMLGPGVALAYNQSIMPLPLVGSLTLLLSLMFRTLAKRYFLRIDWRLVPLLQQNVATWRARTG